MDDPNCQINIEPFYQCCCKCVNLVPDYDNDTMKQKGWICKWSGDDTVYHFSDWQKHSCGCELYTTKEVNDKWRAPYRKFAHRYGLTQDAKLYIVLLFERLVAPSKWKHLRWTFGMAKKHIIRLIREWHNYSE